MELYNECIKDLFNSDSNYLELRGNNNVQIIGLTEVVVTSPLQVRRKLLASFHLRNNFRRTQVPCRFVRFGQKMDTFLPH